jgi:serine/threonine protein kinase
MDAAVRNGEVAHLDLKPENLMIAADGTLKVTDFGSARHVQVVNGRYPGVSNGSWPYMAPEWFGDKPVDSRGDIYSCGVVLYEMLTGHLPFEIDYNGDLFAQMSGY